MQKRGNGRPIGQAIVFKGSICVLLEVAKDVSTGKNSWEKIPMTVVLELILAACGSGKAGAYLITSVRVSSLLYLFRTAVCTPTVWASGLQSMGVPFLTVLTIGDGRKIKVTGALGKRGRSG